MHISSTLFRKCWSTVILALLLASLPIVGQERFGGVSGTVKDPTGALIADASVKILNTETNRVRTTKTRADGTFTVLDIDPGRYTVTVEKEGFSKYEGGNVLVFLGKNSNLDVSMKVGSATEVVEVSAAAQAIDVSSTMISHNVTAEELDRLPKPRDIQSIAVFSPSVNTGEIEGGYQINGASAAENAYYVDGVSTNSVIDGSARQSATFDYVQEVQVKTTGLEAEYGGAMGGVVSAVTKSGGNQYHGDVHYYYYGNLLNAEPTKRMQLNGDGSAFSYFQDVKNKADNHEFGGSLGGPIFKDKLWFFTAASPKWQRRNNFYNYSDDTSGYMNRDATQMNWFSKVSYNPTERIRTNFSFLYTPQYLTGSLLGYNDYAPNATASPSSTAAGLATRGYAQAENSATGQIDFTLTNTSLLSVKGGRYYLNYKENGVPYQWSTNWSANLPPAESIPSGFPVDLLQAKGYTTPTAAQTVHDLTTRAYIQADFSQLFNFGGQHNFKVGFGTQKMVNNVMDSSGGPLGRVNLYILSTCSVCFPADGSITPITGTYGYYSVDEMGTIGSAGANVTHFYVQDSWKIGSRLTINPGIRFEKETIPSFRPDIQKYAFQFGYGDKIAPRIGAAYDLFGNGKVKISGGWGRFYDWTKFDLARGTFGADTWNVYYRTLDTTDVFNINLGNMPGTDLWAAGHPGATFRNRRVPGFANLDPNVKPMSADTMNAGVEWEVSKGMVFTGRFVRNKLNRTIEDMGVIVNGDEVYRYGNPGEGSNLYEPASGASCPVDLDGVCAVPMPKAKRVYDAMELSFSKRFGKGWLGNVSYVYSRLWGNYSGTQSTDEIRPSTLGYGFGGNQAFAAQDQRPGGNANRYFDLDEAFYDAHGVNGLYGRLPTDRPHVVKLYGAKQFKFGTEIGTFFRIMSGTPVTTQVNTVNGIPVYVNGRGDAGRTPVFNQTDLMVAHELKIGKSETKRLRFEFNMINLFNQKTNVYTYDRYNFEETYDSTGIDLSKVDLTQGFDWKSMVAAIPNSTDPRYGKAAVYNQGFQGRFLVKFIF